MTPDPTPSLITYLKAGFPSLEVYQNTVPEEVNSPYVFLQVTGAETWEAIADDTDVFRWFVTCEVTDPAPDVAFDLAEQLRIYLGQTPAGPMGGGTVQGIRVSDQSDDYEIRQPAADEKYHFRALEVQVINYQES